MTLLALFIKASLLIAAAAAAPVLAARRASAATRHLMWTAHSGTRSRSRTRSERGIMASAPSTSAPWPRSGYQRLPLESLIRFRDHGVGPEYLRELNGVGYTGLGLDEVVALRDHGVSADEIRRANARAGTRLTVDRLKALASRGWR
jgi:hypothetical protein